MAADSDGTSLRIGKWIWKDRGGTLRREVSYFKGKEHGLALSFFPDGTKRDERRYEYGELHGLRKQWDEQGRPRGQKCFVRGEYRPRMEDCYDLDAVSIGSVVNRSVPKKARLPASARSTKKP